MVKCFGGYTASLPRTEGAASVAGDTVESRPVYELGTAAAAAAADDDDDGDGKGDGDGEGEGDGAMVMTVMLMMMRMLEVKSQRYM